MGIWENAGQPYEIQKGKSMIKNFIYLSISGFDGKELAWSYN